MKAQDNTTTLQELKDLVAKFRDERDWAKHHSPKNLAMSIAIEAAELMEHFQWDDYTKSNRAEIEAELADVLIYCFNLADTMDIDLSSAFKAKLAKAGQKYPVAIFSGNKDNAEDYRKIKQAYRSKKPQN